MDSAPRKIALFGGTFDPVHLGHLYLANSAQAALALDEVRFLPCKISPHKLETTPISGEDRCEIRKQAVLPMTAISVPGMIGEALTGPPGVLVKFLLAPVGPPGKWESEKKFSFSVRLRDRHLCLITQVSRV